MVNLSSLQNISPPDINTSIFTGDEVVTNLINNANTQTSNYYGLGVMVILFLFLFWFMLNSLDFDLLAAGLGAGGFTFVVGLVFMAAGFFVSFRHIIWFGFIFIILIIFQYITRNKQGG